MSTKEIIIIAGAYIGMIAVSALILGAIFRWLPRGGDGGSGDDGGGGDGGD